MLISDVLPEIGEIGGRRALGTPSRSGSSRCGAPFGGLPSARTTRCQANAVSRGENAADEARRAGIEVAVGAYEPLRDFAHRFDNARSPRLAACGIDRGRQPPALDASVLLLYLFTRV